MGIVRALQCLLGAAALASVAAFAPAGPPAPPEQLPWAHGLDAAQAEAKQRVVPLLVILNMDRERGNEQMVAEVYTSPAVRDAAKRCVVTIASISKHAETHDARTGRNVCSRFGCLTCDEHMATEGVVRKDWLKRGPKDDVDTPRHIFRAPDGRLLFERVWTLDAETLVKLIDRAVLACAPETLAAWDTTAGRMARIADPIDCVRHAALTDLVGAKDPAVDAQMFDLVRKTESVSVVRDVLTAMATDLTPLRVDGMRKLLAAPGASVRMQAAAALASQKGQETFDALVAAFAKEKAPEVKCVLIRAIAVAGGDAAKTRELVLKTAKASEPPLRVHATVALAPWAKDDAVVDLLRKLPANEKAPSGVRAAACWVLGLSARKELAAEIRPLAADRDEILKRVADAAALRLSSGSEGPKYWGFRPWIAPMDVWFDEGDPR